VEGLISHIRTENKRTKRKREKRRTTRTRKKV
jgi:hypothetical protein